MHTKQRTLLKSATVWTIAQLQTFLHPSRFFFDRISIKYLQEFSYYDTLFFSYTNIGTSSRTLLKELDNVESQESRGASHASLIDELIVTVSTYILMSLFYS